VRKLLFRDDAYQLPIYKNEHKGVVLMENNYPIKILKER